MPTHYQTEALPEDIAKVLDRASASPFAEFAPKQRRQLKHSEDPFRDITNLLKGPPAGLAGTVADVLQIMMDVQGGAAHVPVPQLPFTSQHIGELLGADTESKAFQAGLIGTPDPKDLGTLAGIIGGGIINKGRMERRLRPRRNPIGAEELDKPEVIPTPNQARSKRQQEILKQVDRTDRRIGDRRGKIRLTHYGETEGRKVLDPAFSGGGLRGAEQQRKASYPEFWEDRIYYGLDVGKPGGYVREVGLGNVRYDIDIDTLRIYDLKEDPLKLFSKLSEDIPFGARTSVVEQQIKRLGFAGYKVDNAAAIFEKLPTGK